MCFQPQSASSEHTEAQALLRGFCGAAKAAVGEMEGHKPTAAWGTWDVEDRPRLGSPTNILSISPQPPPA